MNRERPVITAIGITLLLVTPLLESTVHSNQQEKGSERPNDRVLLIVDIPSKASTAPDPITQELAQRLVKSGLSVTYLSEFKEKDRIKIRSAAGATVERDRKLLKSVALTLIILGHVSINTLEPFNGLYVAEASGTLKASSAATGKTIAIQNLPTVRGFGNSQSQANRAAFEECKQGVSQDFIDQIIKSNSSRKP